MVLKSYFPIPLMKSLLSSKRKLTKEFSLNIICAQSLLKFMSKKFIYYKNYLTFDKFFKKLIYNLLAREMTTIYTFQNVIKNTKQN